MLKLFLILMLLTSVSFIQGCSTYSTDNHGMGWEYDFITESGIEYRLDHGTSTFTEEELDASVQLVAECMGYPIDTHSLMVIVASPDTMIALRAKYTNDGILPNGLYYKNPNLIVLRGGTHSNEDFRVGHSLKHENAHYILNTQANIYDANHSNGLAQACVSGYN